MANYQFYLSEAEKKAAGVDKMKLEIHHAAFTAALLAIAYAVMAVAKVVSAIPRPAPPTQAQYRPFPLMRDRHQTQPVIEVKPVVKIIDRGSGGIIVLVVIALIVLVIATVGLTIGIAG